MMTLEDLKICPPGAVFACGVSRDSPGGIFVGGTGDLLRWVAKKGDINDFAVYFGQLDWDTAAVAKWGDKVTDIQTVQNLLRCSDEMLRCYRY